MPYRPTSLLPQPIGDQWLTADLFLDIAAMEAGSRYAIEVDLDGLLFNEADAPARFARYELLLDSGHAASDSLLVLTGAKGAILPNTGDESSSSAITRISLVLENTSDAPLTGTNLRLRVSGEAPRALRDDGSSGQDYEAPPAWASGEIVASPFTFKNAVGVVLSARCVVLPEIGDAGPHTHVAADITDFNTAVRSNRLDQMAAPTGNVNLSSQKLTNVAAPTTGGDAANKTYVDGAVAGVAVPDELDDLSDVNAPAPVVGEFMRHNGTEWENSQILSADVPAHNHTASDVSDFDTQVRTNRLTQMAAPNTNLSVAGHRVTNVGTPTASSDAVTKGYLDTALAAFGPYGPPVADLAALRALDTTSTVDKEVRLVEAAEALYGFNSTGTGTDDNDLIIDPTTGPGRWYKLQAATQNHEALLGLLGGAASDHQHLTTAELARLPSADEKAALDGTGTPSVSNKFVTSDDPGMSNERTPTDGSVSTAKLVNGSVTSAKIANDAVTTTKIADDAVTGAKIADSSIATSHLTSGAVTNANLAANAVENMHIADDAVATAQLANSAVETAKIADDAVTTAKIANDAVTTAKIADDAVGSAQIADNAVGSAQIANDAVTTTKIADDAVGSAKIADGAVTLVKTGGIATGKLLGRTTAGTGAAEEIVPGDNMVLDSGALHARLARVTSAVETPSLAEGASANLNVTGLVREGILLRLATDMPARVRGYATNALRAADSARPIPSVDSNGVWSDLPEPGSGLFFEFVTEAGALEIIVSPRAPFGNGDDPVVATLYLAVTRMPGGPSGSQVVEVEMDYLPLEN